LEIAEMVRREILVEIFTKAMVDLSIG